MYCEHFGLDRQPFNNTPDPTFYYSTPEHEEALATLQYATQQRKGFVLVTGEVGAGKTLIGRMFLRTMESEASSAVITHTYLSGNQLLASICREFEIDTPDGANNLELAEKLQEYLLEQYAQNRYVVVLLDEAQNLPDESFEALRMLGNLEADDAKLLQVCILGQPELRERFQQVGMKQINQRLFRRFHLPALTEAQTLEYIQHRIAIAGAGERLIFQPEAVKAIYEASGGTPRLINQICDNALLTGYGQDRSAIDLTVVRQVLDTESVQNDDVSAIAMEESLAGSSEQGEPEAGRMPGFPELPDPDRVSALATEQVERLREQVADLPAGDAGDTEAIQRVLNRQGELQRIVSGATTRWMAVKDRIESYRREIQQLIDGLSGRCSAQQAQLQELAESAAPTEDLEEIRKMHMREIDRVLHKVDAHRTEFTEGFGRLESQWMDLQKQVAALQASAVQQDTFEPICDRLDTWQSEVETFSDALVEQVGGLKKQIRQAHEQLAVLPSLLQATRANEESLQQVTGRLEELNRDVTARITSAETTIAHVRDEAAQKSEVDEISRSHQQALVDLRTRIDALTAETQEQIDAAREMIGRLSRDATTKDAIVQVQERCDGITTSLAERLDALQADTQGMHERLAGRIETVQSEAATRSAFDQQREATAQAIGRVAQQVEALKRELAASHATIEQIAQNATPKDALTELQKRYDDTATLLSAQLEKLQIAARDATAAFSDRLAAMEADKASRSEFQKHCTSVDETFARISDEVQTLRSEAASADDLEGTRRAQEEAFGALDERIARLQQEMERGLLAAGATMARLESDGASADDVERFRIEQKALLAEVHQRLDHDTRALDVLRTQVREAQADAEERHRASLDQLAQRVDEQVHVLKTMRQKFLEQHANVHNRLNELTECSATREEVEELRRDQDARSADVVAQIESSRRGVLSAIDGVAGRLQTTREEMERYADKEHLEQLRRDQDERSVDVLTQIESSRRAVLGMIDGIAGRLQATRDEMEGLADREQVAELRRDHEREITLLLSRLDEEKLAVEQRFADATQFCRKLQADKAEAGDVAELGEQQKKDSRSFVESLAVQRKDLEYLVRSVNERCDVIAARIQNIPERFPSCDEVADLRAKTESDIDDLNQRWEAMQASFAQLTATAAPAERLDAVEQELSAHLTDLDRELKERFDELNARVQTDVEGLTRHVDQNVEALSRRVGEDVEGLTRRVDHDVEGLSRHVDENVGELSHRLDTTQTRLTEAQRQQTLHLRTIVNKMQEMGQRLFAMERTQPLQISLTPKEVAELKELLATAKGRNESLAADLSRAESTTSQLREASAQIEEVMRTWSENASAVQTQSDELRASAGTARELLAVMKRFHEALDAKLKSERWQTELERGEQLAARLEQAVNEARTLTQQLKAARSDSQEERERCGQEYDAAKSTADRLAKLVAQADDATAKFKGLLTGIMRSTSNISAAIETARTEDEKTRPSRGSEDQEVTSVRNVQWPTMRTTA